MGTMKLKIAAGLICLTVGFLFFAGFAQEHSGETAFDSGNNPTINVIPVQLGREKYGLAMIDTEAQTLWVYEFDARGQASFGQLRLIAARSFEYDRKLTEWNTVEPTPTQVKKILESLEKQTQVKEQKQQEKKVEELQQLLEQD